MFRQDFQHPSRWPSYSRLLPTRLSIKELHKHRRHRRRHRRRCRPRNHPRPRRLLVPAPPRRPAPWALRNRGRRQAHPASGCRAVHARGADARPTFVCPVYAAAHTAPAPRRGVARAASTAHIRGGVVQRRLPCSIPPGAAAREGTSCPYAFHDLRRNGLDDEYE